MNKHRIVRLILVFFIGMFFTSQVFPQILKREQIKRDQIKGKTWAQSQDQLFVQSNMFVNSDTSEVTVHFLIKNNDQNGAPIQQASVLVNGSEIREKDPGNYYGVARVSYQSGVGYPVDSKIVTRDGREVTSSGRFDSLLKLDISNIFPRQPDKIEVGEPVTIRWSFVPGPQKAVDLVLTNVNTNGIVYQKRGAWETQVVIPVRTIPVEQKIMFSVEVPMVQFQFNQAVNGASFIHLYIKTSRTLLTFG